MCGCEQVVKVSHLTPGVFWRGLTGTCGGARLSPVTPLEVVRMSSMWALIEACFADARKAEEMLGDLSAKRELRLDPENALAAFVIWKGPLSTARLRKIVTPRRSRAYAGARS